MQDTNKTGTHSVLHRGHKIHLAPFTYSIHFCRWTLCHLHYLYAAKSQFHHTTAESCISIPAALVCRKLLESKLLLPKERFHCTKNSRTTQSLESSRCIDYVFMCESIKMCARGTVVMGAVLERELSKDFRVIDIQRAAEEH